MLRKYKKKLRAALHACMSAVPTNSVRASSFCGMDYSNLSVGKEHKANASCTGVSKSSRYFLLRSLSTAAEMAVCERSEERKSRTAGMPGNIS